MQNNNMLKRSLRYILVRPLLLIVALYVVFEEFLNSVVKPLVAYLSSFGVLVRLADFLRRLSPYTLFAIYACKLAAFGSVKLFALYLIANGHADGVYLLVAGETCGAVITVWYARVAFPSLLTLGWFAAGYCRLKTLKDELLALIRRLPVYRYVQAKVQALKLKLAALKEYVRRRAKGTSRIKAAYRFVTRKGPEA